MSDAAKLDRWIGRIAAPAFILTLQSTHYIAGLMKMIFVVTFGWNVAYFCLKRCIWEAERVFGQDFKYLGRERNIWKGVYEEP